MFFNFLEESVGCASNSNTKSRSFKLGLGWGITEWRNICTYIIWEIQGTGSIQEKG